MSKLLLVLLVGLLATGMIRPKASALKGSVTNENRAEQVISAEIGSKESSPVPVPTQPKKVVPLSYSKQQIIDYIYTKSWNGATAVRVFTCESGLNPFSVNWGDAQITGYPSSGIAQINAPQNWDWSNPYTNIDRAYRMYSSRGWQPWSCARILGII